MNSTSHTGVAPNRDGLANTATGPSVTPGNVLAPNTSRSAHHTVPKKTKLTLNLLAPKPSTPKLAAKSSHSKLSKENPAKKKNPPPSSFVEKPQERRRSRSVGEKQESQDEKQEKRRSRLGGSASKLGGLGSLVRHASKGLLKDVTNARQSSDEVFDTSRFVNVGVEDASDDGGDQMVVDIIEATPCEPNTPQTALDSQDPDISEVMVVKRSKSRTPIDFQWAESGQTTARTRVRDNGIESDMEGGTRKPKTGWWKRKNEGAKDEVRPKMQRRLSALLSPSSKPEELPPQDKSKSEVGDSKGSFGKRAILSPRSLNQDPPEGQAVAQETPPKPSPPPKPLPPKPSPPEKTLRRATKMTLGLRRPSESKVSLESGGISSTEGSTSRLAPSSFRRRTVRHVSQPIASTEPSEVTPVEVTPVEVRQLVESPTVEPFTRPILRNPGSRPTSRPNSRVSSCPSSAVHGDNRLSVVSILTNEDSQGGQSSSDTKKDRRCSTGSIVRWDPEAMSQQAKKMRIEREERMKQRAEEERERIMNGLPPPERNDKKQRILAARRRTPVMAIFDDLDLSVVDRGEEQALPHTPLPRVAVDPIIAATQAMLLQSVTASPAKQSPRSRFGFRERFERPRPVGIVVTEPDGNDAAMSALNAANNDLQEMLGNADLSFTPERAPSLPSVAPSTRTGSITSNRRMPYQDQVETERPPLARRTSGSGVVSHQVATWPPAPPPKDSPSLSPTDSSLPTPRQRKRTSSSTVSVPPSAFNRKVSLVTDEEVLPLRIMRSENGNVARKTRFYGDLERGSSIEREFGSRNRTSSQPREEPSQRLRARLNSLPALEIPGGVDITTDIPEELHNILVQTEPVVVPPSQPAKEEPQAKTGGSDESAQEFVYTGIDAIPENSIDQEYSVVKEFSSYDEVSKVDLPVREVSPTPPPKDIFAPTKPPIHRAPESVTSIESDASYCVILKPTAPLVLHKRQISVESPNQTINDTFAFASKPNPLNATSKASGVLRNHRRSRHRRAPSLTPGSPTSTHQSTGSHDDNFSFAVATEDPTRGSLADILTSATSETEPEKSPQPDEVTRRPTSPESFTSGGPASVDSFFDRSHNRKSSSTSSIFTVFGIDQGSSERKGTAGRGNLFGQGTRPLSLISSYSDVGVVSDEEAVHEKLEHVDETDGETPVKPKSTPKPTPSPAKVLPRPSPVKVVKSTEMEKMEKMLDEEIYATAPRPRPHAVAAPSGHFRRRTTLGLSRRPMTIAEAIQKMEMYESALPVEGEPTRDRGSSTTDGSTDASATTNASSTSSRSLMTDASALPAARSSLVPRHVSCASWHASTSWEDFRMVTIAGGEPEMDGNMVLRRYYTFQREAQEALDQSHNKWKDTAFSMDEVTTFQPPTRVEEVANFLNESRRFYSELPVESKARARRRAKTAPYPASINAHLEDKPGSRSGSGSSSPVDAVFKNLSMWDHRRMPKSEKRMRRVSEEGRRSRKTSATKTAQGNERVRKVSEKKKRANVNADNSSVDGGPSNPPSMSRRERGVSPVMDASEDGVMGRTRKASKTLTVNTTNVKPSSSLNTDINGNATIGRARATVLAKVALRLQQLEQEQAQEGEGQESEETGKENATKVNALQHGIEGILESPTGSLRIARPRPKRKSMTTAVSPPSSIRL